MGLPKLQVPMCTPDFLSESAGSKPWNQYLQQTSQSGSGAPLALALRDLEQDLELYKTLGNCCKSSKKVSIPRDGPLIKEK